MRRYFLILWFTLIAHIDKLYADIVWRGDIKNLNKEDIDKIQQISSEVYSSSLITYDDVEIVEDICGLYGCFLSQLDYISGKDYYFIIIRHFNYIELADFAAKNERCSDIFHVYSLILKKYGKYKVGLRARENTSYRLIKMLEQHNKIVILKDKVEEVCGENFHFLMIRKKE